MKKFLLLFGALSIGYYFGNLLPIRDIFAPKKEIQFKEDYLVKAGTRALIKRFPIKKTYSIEITIGLSETEPHVELVN